MENSIENAKQFIDELKDKGNYYLNYESVAEMLFRYAEKLRLFDVSTAKRKVCVFEQKKNHINDGKCAKCGDYKHNHKQT